MAEIGDMASPSYALLKDVLLEAQTSVRSYDTKAQIVGIGYIFALNIISSIGGLSSASGSGSLLTISAAWLLVIAPIVLFGFVLYPTRKSRRGKDPMEFKRIYYLLPQQFPSTSDLLDAVEGCDPLHEISNEVLQVSALRETKRKRFVFALVAAAITFSAFFAGDLALSL